VAASGSPYSSGRESRLIPVGKGTLAEGLYIRVTVPEFFEQISRSRRKWGHAWSEIEKVLVLANQRMAEGLQLMAAQELEYSRFGTRKKYTTHRLEATILAPENVFNTGRRWGVGRVKWMNTASPAKMYWRQIEEGSTVHLDRQVHGLFHDGFEFHKASAKRAHMDDVMIGNVYGFIIQKPIEPHYFFRNAWREYNVKAQARAALQEAVTEVLGITFKSSRPTMKTIVNSMR